MCVFCKIIVKEIPAQVIFESDNVMAFRDANPRAPVHVLIIPKKHVTSMNYFQEDDKETLGEMMLLASRLAKDLQIAEKGYKLLIRTGEHGGQEVAHMHMHLMGGMQMD